MSLSFLGMSASFSICVQFFRCQSFPYISRRVDWFPCPLFPFHSPCTLIVFISVPFMSLSVPLCFPCIFPCLPVMSTSYFLPSFPCTSLHFRIFPPKKETRFFQRCRKKDVTKHELFQMFGKRRQETQTSKEPAWDPCSVIKLPRGTWGTP